MLAIAHRGASGYEFENTLAAIKKALLLNADMIELDVRLSADGKVLILHDIKVNRITNGKGSVHQLELNSIKTFKTKNNEQIPTLEEALSIINKRAKVDIDIKDYAAIELILAIINNVCKHHGWKKKDFLISAISIVILRKVRKLDKEIPVAINFVFFPQLFLLFSRLLKTTIIKPHRRLISEKFMKQVKQKQLTVYTWTINTKEDIEKMRALGVDGIVTDYPDRIHG